MRQVGRSTSIPSTMTREWAALFGGGESLDDTPAARHLAITRRHFIVDETDVGNVDRAFRPVADAPGTAGVATAALGIGPGVGHVDGRHPGCPALDDKALPGVVQLGEVRRALQPEIRRQVLGSQQQGADARTGAGDVRTGDEGGGALEIGNDFRRPRRIVEILLESADPFVEPSDAVGIACFRQHDDIGLPRHGLSQVLLTAILQRIDAHGGHLARLPPRRVQRPGKAACQGSVRRQREVLQFLDQDIGLTRCGLHETALVGPGEKQPAATQCHRSSVRHQRRFSRAMRWAWMRGSRAQSLRR